VGNGKGVIDVDVAAVGESLGKIGIVLLLSFIKTDVFQHEDVARLHGVYQPRNFLADAVGGEFYFFVQQAG